MRKRKVKTKPIYIVEIALKYARAAKEEAAKHTMRRDIITTNAVERMAYGAAEGALRSYRSKLKWRGIL